MTDERKPTTDEAMGMNLSQKIMARLEAMKEPPWYVQLLVVVVGGFIGSVAIWFLVATLLGALR